MKPIKRLISFEYQINTQNFITYLFDYSRSRIFIYKSKTKKLLNYLNSSYFDLLLIYYWYDI